MVHHQNKKYTHLKQEEREEIFLFVREWKSLRRIWRKIWRSHTSISRELNRNVEKKWRWEKRKYSPSKAQRMSEERRMETNRKRMILYKDHSLHEKIVSLLKDKGKNRWLDEIIWRLKLEWNCKISTGSAYRFIREERKDLQKYLRFWAKWYRTKKKWNKRTKWYTDVPNISERWEIANERREIWHWEWDTVVSGKIAKWWIVSMLERRSRYYLIKKVNNLKAETARITIEAMMKWEKVLSATFDNWVEFWAIWNLPFQCYRADPYASYQRWGNERHNWLFRVYVPKWSDISKYTEEEIYKIQNEINHKPRKILWYKSPYEVYHNVEKKYISK